MDIFGKLIDNDKDGIFSLLIREVLQLNPSKFPLNSYLEWIGAKAYKGI
jgi:hypothetical protein